LASKKNNGVGTDHKFTINGSEYEGTTSYSFKKEDSFLIIYDSLKPKNNKVLGFYEIKYYLTNLSIPKNGWKYTDVPFNIDSSEIRKELLE
jgi:hypothetical protein